MEKTKHVKYNNLVSHGLLAEDFKKNLLGLVQNHKLDIQTKAIILDSVLLATNIAASQQTQKEIEEYNKSHIYEEPSDKKESS